MTKTKAIAKAKKLAKEGPRVSAVLRSGDGRIYHAVPGYIDEDKGALRQVLLVTPDGRVWQQELKS